MASLAPVRATGGDRFAREPKRAALAWLQRALGRKAEHHPAALGIEPNDLRRKQVLELGARRGVDCSSAGRLFDAAAAILGLSEENRFEAESAMALEAIAAKGVPRPEAPAVTLQQQGDAPIVIDPSELILWMAATQRSREDAAASFHARLAEGFAQSILQVSHESGIRLAGVTGGVAVNQLWSIPLRSHLEQHGLTVLTHARVPPNDGGISLGQAAIAESQLRAESSRG